jgi:alpha-beta hydrolase superfamily lysophospholipase
VFDLDKGAETTGGARRSHRRGVAMLAALVFVASMVVVPPATAAPDVCRTVEIPVTVRPGDSTRYTVLGQLCGAAPGRTVQVLVSGATYGHLYWDWPQQPETYSYVRAANDAGYATFNYDRLGIGHSGHPPAVDLTTGSGAWVLHQIVTTLRHESSTQDSRVMSVGHSLGSLIAMTEAGVYHDVDAVALTGITHVFATVNSAVLFGTMIPAQLDPVLAARGLPLGYLTTAPGMRATDFYYTPTADPGVIADDEATKETITPTELATVVAATPAAAAITAPVLVLDGEYDQLVCGALGQLTPCSLPVGYLTAERVFYPRARSYDAAVVPGSGHSLTLQRTAAEAAHMLLRWSDDRVGPGSSR